MFKIAITQLPNISVSLIIHGKIFKYFIVLFILVFSV